MTASMNSLFKVAKNTVMQTSDVVVRVKEATSNEKWGPTGQQMREIADATNNYRDFSEIMDTIFKRLNDSGKNWRHVYKSLLLIDHLIRNGSEQCVRECRNRVVEIETLTEFQYIDEFQKDVGLSVRERARIIKELLHDEKRIDEEREKARSVAKKFGASMGSDNERGYGGGGSYGASQPERYDSYDSGSDYGGGRNDRADYGGRNDYGGGRNNNNNNNSDYGRNNNNNDYKQGRNSFDRDDDAKPAPAPAAVRPRAASGSGAANLGVPRAPGGAAKAEPSKLLSFDDDGFGGGAQQAAAPAKRNEFDFFDVPATSTPVNNAQFGAFGGAGQAFGGAGQQQQQFGGSSQQFGGSSQQFGGSSQQFGGSSQQFGGSSQQFGGGGFAQAQNNFFDTPAQSAPASHGGDFADFQSGAASSEPEAADPWKKNQKLFDLNNLSLKDSPVSAAAQSKSSTTSGSSYRPMGGPPHSASMGSAMGAPMGATSSSVGSMGSPMGARPAATPMGASSTGGFGSFSGAQTYSAPQTSFGFGSGQQQQQQGFGGGFGAAPATGFGAAPSSGFGGGFGGQPQQPQGFGFGAQPQTGFGFGQQQSSFRM